MTEQRPMWTVHNSYHFAWARPDGGYYLLVPTLKHVWNKWIMGRHDAERGYYSTDLERLLLSDSDTRPKAGDAKQGSTRE